MFKGLLDKWAPLSTYIERMSRQWEIELKYLPKIECNLIRDFQRKYPETAPKPSPKEDYLWWLALMQHHGAPTRLLDFTYSPYVASYFAFEYLLLQGDPDSRAAIYAVNRDWVDRETKIIIEGIVEQEQWDDKNFFKKLKEAQPDTFHPLFMKSGPKKPFVCMVNPWRLNQRLAIQQGIFMVPVDITKPLMDNLKGIDGWDDAGNLVKYVIEGGIKETEKVLDELYTMNITQNTLFPGLDGYSKSLITRMKFFKNL